MQFKAFAPYNLRMKAAPGLTQMFTTKEITGEIRIAFSHTMEGYGTSALEFLIEFL